MDITSLGHSSFKIKTKNATIVTDPFDSTSVGIKFPKNITADIITISHDHEDHNAKTNIDGTPFFVQGPGEYEIKGVSIAGLATFHDNEKGAKRGRNTVYRITADGISMVHLGDVGHLLASDDIEFLDGVDVLFIPVGGVYTIDAQAAAHLAGDLEPKIIIPMHYHKDLLNQKTFGSLTPVDAFLKEMGKEGVAPISKLTITRDKLPEEMQIVVLE